MQAFTPCQLWTFLTFVSRQDFLSGNVGREKKRNDVKTSTVWFCRDRAGRVARRLGRVGVNLALLPGAFPALETGCAEPAQPGELQPGREGLK